MHRNKPDANSFSARLITLAGPIDMDAVAKVSAQLAALNGASHDPIVMHVISGGGMMAAGAALYDLIRCSPSPVTTVGFGAVASAAVIVFQAGHVRLLSPMARLVLHEAKMSIEGELNAHDLLMTAKEIAFEDQRLDMLVAARSRQPLPRIQKWSQETKEFFAEDAVKYRLADGILPLPRHAAPKAKKRRARRRAA